jgi:hypothetical protein
MHTIDQVACRACTVVMSCGQSDGAWTIGWVMKPVRERQPCLPHLLQGKAWWGKIEGRKACPHANRTIQRVDMLDGVSLSRA